MWAMTSARTALNSYIAEVRISIGTSTPVGQTCVHFIQIVQAFSDGFTYGV